MTTLRLGYATTAELEPEADDASVPASGRPATLDAMIGQAEVVARLRIVVNGAAARGVKLPHILLSGPAGTGKTTTAGIVASMIGGNLIVTSGPVLRRVADLTGILMSAPARSVVLIDEIHRMTAAPEEVLYDTLEDGTLSIVTGAGRSAQAVRLRLPPMVFIGATTKPGAISTPLRDRFGCQLEMAPYSLDEITAIVLRAWQVTTPAHPRIADAATIVAGAAKGVPRLALHLAARVQDVSAVYNEPIGPRLAERALAAFGIDESGLNELDKRILVCLCQTFKGRPVGLASLAQALDVDVRTIQEAHEGPLVRAGLMLRTPSGRMATPEAYELVRGGLT